MATLPDNQELRTHRLPEPSLVPVSFARAEFAAMGTTISLLAPVEHMRRATEIVHSLFVSWEQSLSRFLPDSELSRLNGRAGEFVPVSELLFTVLVSALEAAEATDGLYDPSLLNQLELIGYDQSFATLPERLPASNPLDLRPGGHWRGIYLDHENHLVWLPPEVRLDFGGIAKGMAVDAALEELQRAGITVALVNAGGDLAVSGEPPVEQQWPVNVVGLSSSWVLPLRRGACATSGISHRRWYQGEHLRHHLLDPRSGSPVANDLWSVTVVAPTCTQAEVAAKTAFLLGIEEGNKFLLRHFLTGLFVRKDGSFVTSGSWPQESLSSAAVSSGERIREEGTV